MAGTEVGTLSQKSALDTQLRISLCIAGGIRSFFLMQCCAWVGAVIEVKVGTWWNVSGGHFSTDTVCDDSRRGRERWFECAAAGRVVGEWLVLSEETST